MDTNIFNIKSQKAERSIVNIGLDMKIKYPDDEKTIWKYPLKITDKQLLQLPIRSEILTVQIQNGRPQLWALVNPKLPTEEKQIYIYGTGHKLSNSNNLKYISTIQIDNGLLMFHVFESKNRLPEEM